MKIFTAKLSVIVLTFMLVLVLTPTGAFASGTEGVDGEEVVIDGSIAIDDDALIDDPEPGDSDDEGGGTIDEEDDEPGLSDEEVYDDEDSGTESDTEGENDDIAEENADEDLNDTEKVIDEDVTNDEIAELPEESFEEPSAEEQEDVIEAMGASLKSVYFRNPIDGTYDDNGIAISLRPEPYIISDFIDTNPVIDNIDEEFDIICVPVSNNAASLTDFGILTTKALGTVNVRVYLKGKEGGTYDGEIYTRSTAFKIVIGLNNIALSQKVTKKLAVTKSFTPKVAYTPKNAGVKNAIWSVNPADSNIVRVNEFTGKVTALSPGRARVVLTAEPFAFGDTPEDALIDGNTFITGYEVFVPATKIDIKVDGITVNGHTLRMVPPGDENSLYTDFSTSVNLFAEAVTAAGCSETIVWRSSDSKLKPEKRIVELIDNGDGTATVNALKNGLVTLTAKAGGGKTAAVKINIAKTKAIEIEREDGLTGEVVLHVPVSGYDNPDTINEIELSITGSGYEEPIKWSASKSGIVRIDADSWYDGTYATIEARNPGKVTLTAKDRKGRTAKIKVTVRYPVTYVYVTKPKSAGITLSKGKSYTMKAAVDKKASNKGVTWTSLDPEIASVNSKGVVKGLAEGSARIIVRSKENPDAESFAWVLVQNKLKKISVAQKNFTMPEGASATLNVITNPPGCGTWIDFAWLPNRWDVVEFDSEYYWYIEHIIDTGYFYGWGDTLNIYAFGLPKGKTSQKVKLSVYDLDFGKKTSVTVTVKKNAEPVHDFKLSKNVTWLQRGKSEKMKPVFNETINPATGKKWPAPSNKQVVYEIESERGYDLYSAPNGSVAKIDRYGKVTATGYGIVEVNAYSVENPSALYDTCLVFCVPKP